MTQANPRAYALGMSFFYITAGFLAGTAILTVLQRRVGQLNRYFPRKLAFQWKWNRKYLLTGRN